MDFFEKYVLGAHPAIFLAALVILFLLGRKFIFDRSKKKRDKRQSSIAKVKSFIPQYRSDLDWAFQRMNKHPDLLHDFKMFVHLVHYADEYSVYDRNRLADYNHDYKSIYFKLPFKQWIQTKSHRGKAITFIIIHEMAHGASGSGDHDDPKFKEYIKKACRLADVPVLWF